MSDKLEPGTHIRVIKGFGDIKVGREGHVDKFLNQKWQGLKLYWVNFSEDKSAAVYEDELEVM